MSGIQLHQENSGRQKKFTYNCCFNINLGRHELFLNI